MQTPQQKLEAIVTQAAEKILPGIPLPSPLVRPCLDPRHGDFQSNVALVTAKAAKKKPHDLADEFLKTLKSTPLAEPPTLAGPGFINFKLQRSFCQDQVLARVQEPRLGIPLADTPQTIVIDFSAPNVAKEMHVGHLRSTILGDTLVRLHRFLGHRVIADNHIGDWGTQFGMVILGFKREGNEQALQADPFGHLEMLYKKVQNECQENQTTQEAARAELLKLQQGDEENLKLWRRFIDISMTAADQIYAQLGVTFDTTYGESHYHSLLAPVVDELLQQGIAQESDGALCVFSDRTLPVKEDPLMISDKNAPEGFRDNPFLIRKRDGAFLYATTDLATLQFRLQEYTPHRIIYVTDGRQQMHFAQLFAVAQRWGKANPPQLEHAWFGKVLGADKKPIKTREGTPLKLRDLVAEAQTRAQQIIKEKRPDLPQEDCQKLASVVGIGALKYADLAQNRNLDYLFEWNKLLAFKGNTAPYLQNAYVRTRSLFRKSNLKPEIFSAPSILLEEAAEEALAKTLLAFGDTLTLTAQENRPHHLCHYLYQVAEKYHQFWETCPILHAEKEDLKQSRLALTQLTGKTLQLGLNLLGIEVPEQM